MSWIHKSSTQTRSNRSGSLTTTEKIMTTINRSKISSQTSSPALSSTASIESLTTSVESSASEKTSATPQTLAVQKLYLLLPNHKCPNKKTCPFHPPEEEEKELEEAEMTLVNKRRAMSLTSHEDRMISEQLLSEKLAKINQQISSNLLESNKLHFPRKTSHDITLPATDLDRLRYDHSNTPATNSTREESVASDYDLDSGVTFDSCSDRELDEDTLPLIQEEFVVPDIVLPAETKLQIEAPKQITSTEAETTIQISETSTVDSGTFTYQAASSPEEAATSSETILIEEHISEAHTKPSFIKELEYLTVTEGSLVRLECVVTGDPRPNIKWFKNDQRIDSMDDFKMLHSDDGTVALIIEGAEVEDSGSYSCVADNIAGSATTQSKIRVQKATEELPEPVYQRPEDKDVKKQKLLVPPEFTAKLKNKTIEEGGSVHLNCSITGIPEPTCRWLKDGKEIFDDFDFTIRNNGGFLSLGIACATQSLAGEYTVKASNSEGTISCSCILQIEGDKEIEPLELDIQRPKFISKIQDVHVKEGEDVTFTCIAAGKPVPDFKWQRDMINITTSDSVVIESNNQGQAQLTLKKVKPSDRGLYCCVAQSKSGRAKCYAYLHVTARSTSPESIKEDIVQVKARKAHSVERESNLGSSPSLVLMLPDTLDIVVGGKLKLDSSVQGYPMPLVTWHKGDRGLMYSQRHRIVPCGTLHTMEIPQVMALDKGEYIVRATNIYGTVQSSCYVNILPKGSKVSAPDYIREPVIVTAKQNLQAPYFVKHLPKSIDALLGMSVRLDCILREGIELIKWSKSEELSLQEVERDKKELVDEGFHGDFIPLEAKTHEKSRSYSVDKRESDVAIKKSSNQETRPEPISFTTTPKDLVQPAGSEAIFECSTSGVPEPEVTWYKNGKILTATNRVKVVTESNKQTLRITDICSADEGVYTCKLNHLAEEQACRAVLTVTGEVPDSRPSKVQPNEPEKKSSTDKKAQEQPVIQEKQEKPDKYEKPSFKQLLPKTTIANYGDSVELVCQLTSSDVTNVKWELNGSELSQDIRYLVSSDEFSNQYKLAIHTLTEQDSAKYTCVALLKNGDVIHTSTKLNVSATKPVAIEKNDDFKPHFITSLKDTVVKDGEGLILECDIEGNPRPQILWFRDDMEIFDSPDFEISTIGSHCKLQISEMYPEDEGKYSCRAVNTLGEAVNSCYVSVEDKNRPRRGEPKEAPEDKKKSKKDEEKPELPPELVVKPRRQFIDVGGKAKFKASFDGSKDTVLFWSKNGQVLENGENFLMYEADGFHFLEIKEVSAEDCGMYSVTVQNFVGSDTAEAELEVFEKPKLLTRSGPEWEQTLQNLTAEEGDTDVKLICICKELTQPSARWFHNGKEVFSGFHIKLQQVAQTSTLTIKEIQERDAGEFKCAMTGKNGELVTSCILSLKSAEIMEPPIFVKELRDMEVDEGDKLELDVEVKGTSLVRVSWFHNNVEIMHDNPQYSIASLGNIHTLTMLQATSEASGEYVCEAINDTGNADTYCFVEVREVKHPEPPSFVIHPTSRSAHEGETATFTCQVKGQPLPNALWKKGGITIASNQKFKITRINDCHSLTVYNISHTDEGEYICNLHNIQGDMSYPCKLHVVSDQTYSWQPQTESIKRSRYEASKIPHKPEETDSETKSSISILKNSQDSPLSRPANLQSSDKNFRTVLSQSNIRDFKENNSLEDKTEAVDKIAYAKRDKADNKFESTQHVQQTIFQHKFNSDSHHQREKDCCSLDSENFMLKQKPLKVDLSKLSACKVSISEFNPSEPQSEALILEVTSVTASVPLRQSLSSPLFHPQPHMTHSDHLAVHNSDIKIDDNDVFTDTFTDVIPFYREHRLNSKPDSNKHNLQSFGSSFTWEKTPGNETVEKQVIVSNNSINQNKDTKSNQVKRSSTRFSENSSCDHQEIEGFTNKSFASSISETSSSSDTPVPESNLLPKVKDNIVDDFRNVKLKSAAQINKDKYDLARSKFMSKSTESIFTDIKLKPVSKSIDISRKSEISSNAERIRASSKSSELSHLFSTSSYTNTPKYSLKPASTPANATSKFSDIVLSFSNDAKPRSFQHNFRFQKPVQSKFRTSGKSEKAVSAGGVTRTNSYRKSKGIGAKFEAAIKDLKASNEKVSYTSLHTARNNQAALKPPEQTNVTGYRSERGSENIQYIKAAETRLSQKGLKKNVNTASKSNRNTANLDSSSENYQSHVTDWVKKRQSLQIDSSPARPSVKNTFSDAGRLSTSATDIFRKLEDDSQTPEVNNFNKASRSSELISSRDEMHNKTEKSNKKFSKDTEFRIRARSRKSNPHDSSGTEWPTQDIVMTQLKQEITNLETNTDFNDQEQVTNSSDSSELISGADCSSSTRKSSQINTSNMRTLPISSLRPSESSYENDKSNNNNESMSGRASVTVKLANHSNTESEMFKSVVTMTKKNEIQESPFVTKPVTRSTISTTLPSAGAGNVKTLSTIIAGNVKSTTGEVPSVSVYPSPTTTKVQLLSTSGIGKHHVEESDAENLSIISAFMSSDLKENSGITSAEDSVHKESLSRQEGSLEFQTENEQFLLGNTRSSWIKQKNQRHVNVYPGNGTELSPCKESLKLITDDSESVLSMASTSSWSSDGSNATADSGYTRNHLRKVIGNENNYTVPEMLHPENVENWNQISCLTERNKVEFSDAKFDICKSANAKLNSDNDLPQNTEENISLTTNLNDRTRRLRSLRRNEDIEEVTQKTDFPRDLPNERQPNVKCAGGYEDQLTNTDLIHHKSQFRNPSQAQTSGSLGFQKEVTNITTQSNMPAYISRRQRRQLEKSVTANKESNTKPKVEAPVQESLSKSYSSEVITYQTTSNELMVKENSFSNENPPAEVYFPAADNKDLGNNLERRDAKSESMKSESNMSAEPDRPKSRSNLEYMQHKKDTYITKKVASEQDEPKEDLLEHKQAENVLIARHRFHFREESDVESKISETESSQDKFVSKGFLNDEPKQNYRFSNDKDQHPNQRISCVQYRKNSIDKTALSSTVNDQDEIKLSKSQILPAASTSPSSTLLPAPIMPETFSLQPNTLEEDKELHSSPPNFPVPLHDTSVVPGAQAVLQCQVTGNPRPEVKWLLNLKQIEPSKAIEITYIDDIAQLRIMEMLSKHAGDYTCMARNLLGTVSSHCTLGLENCHPKMTDTNTSCATAEVFIKTEAGKMSACHSNSPGSKEQPITDISRDGVPDAPVGRPLVCVQEGNSASVSWGGPFFKGEDQEIYYIIEAKTKEEESWNVIMPHCKELYCNIQELKPNTTYQFRVLAANRHGVSPPSESSEAIISDSSILTSDQEYENDFLLSAPDVLINIKDKFEDLYEVDKVVGKGKFGIVYKCKQKTRNTILAAKVIKCREKDKIGLRREIEIMNKLRHPKLLLLWDAFETPRQMVLVMEYISAGELFERVTADEFVLTENDCINFMRQICEGVGYMHSKNIIHLDLKPENILCVAENSNRIKIIDFGMAQFYNPGQSTKVLFGTPEFVAPEVINYDEVSFATDMWSLGVICYVLLSGLSPFSGDNDSETLANVTKGEYDFDDEAFEEITDLAKDFICNLLIKRKEKRILTGQCLAHPWLNQDEVDGTPAKRLNTEKLKKFMIRQKWLKTGNAVKAVSRLLKSNSLGAFGRSISSDNAPDTPSYNRATSNLIQSAQDVIDVQEDEEDSTIVNDQIIADTSKVLECVSQNLLEAISSSREENFLSTKNQSSFSEVDTLSTWKNTATIETLTISSDKNSLHFLSEVTSGEDMDSVSKKHETISSIINSSSSLRTTDTNKNVGKIPSSSVSLPLSMAANSGHSGDLMSSTIPKEKDSLQSSNRRTKNSEATFLQTPSFTKVMTRCKTCAGDVARFDVVVAGNPLPRVIWLLEGEEIHPDTRRTLRSNENTRSFSLTIRNVEEDDEGEYSCKAINTQGECTCVAELVVLSI